MTKRHHSVPAIDLENLVQANKRFKAAHEAMGRMQTRLANEEDVPPDLPPVVMAEFVAASVHLFTQSNTIVKLVNKAAAAPMPSRLILP